MNNKLSINQSIRVFHGFGQARYDDGLLLGSNLFSLLPQLPQKTGLIQNGQN